MQRCSGAPGVVQSRHRAAGALGDACSMQTAEQAAAISARQRALFLKRRGAPPRATRCALTTAQHATRSLLVACLPRNSMHVLHGCARKNEPPASAQQRRLLAPLPRGVARQRGTHGAARPRVEPWRRRVRRRACDADHRHDRPRLAAQSLPRSRLARWRALPAQHARLGRGEGLRSRLGALACCPRQAGEARLRSSCSP